MSQNENASPPRRRCRWLFSSAAGAVLFTAGFAFCVTRVAVWEIHNTAAFVVLSVAVFACA